MTFQPGQKVELNALGRKRVEGDSIKAKNRRHGEIIAKSRVSAGCYRIKWATRKSEDFLHEDFIMDATGYVESSALKTIPERLRELRRTDDGDPFNAGFNAALDNVADIL